jgi:hypothetical protein
MAGMSEKIVIVLNEGCGDALGALLQQGPVWLLESEANRAVAEAARRAQGIDGEAEVTLFRLATPWLVEELADIIPMVVEHHANAKTIEIHGLSEMWRKELESTGLRLQVASPGVVRYEIRRGAGR